jgi:hypothetical protein
MALGRELLRKRQLDISALRRDVLLSKKHIILCRIERFWSADIENIEIFILASFIVKISHRTPVASSIRETHIG